jgi:hypothetical protein
VGSDPAGRARILRQIKRLLLSRQALFFSASSCGECATRVGPRTRRLQTSHSMEAAVADVMKRSAFRPVTKPSRVWSILKTLLLSCRSPSFTQPRMISARDCALHRPSEVDAHLDFGAIATVVSRNVPAIQRDGREAGAPACQHIALTGTGPRRDSGRRPTRRALDTRPCTSAGAAPHGCAAPARKASRTPRT